MAGLTHAWLTLVSNSRRLCTTYFTHILLCWKRSFFIICVILGYRQPVFRFLWSVSTGTHLPQDLTWSWVQPAWSWVQPTWSWRFSTLWCHWIGWEWDRARLKAPQLSFTLIKWSASYSCMNLDNDMLLIATAMEEVPMLWSEWATLLSEQHYC